MQYKYTEASEALTKAQKQFLDIGNALGVAQHLQSLRDILYMQDQYTKTSEALTGAQSNSLKLVLPLVQPNAYKAWVTFFACRPNTLKALRL